MPPFASSILGLVVPRNVAQAFQAQSLTIMVLLHQSAIIINKARTICYHCWALVIRKRLATPMIVTMAMRVSCMLSFFSKKTKPTFAHFFLFTNTDIDLKQLNSGNLPSSASSAATAAAMLAANGYSAAFPFLQHLSAANSQQQQQLVAAAAALGLPALPNR